VEVKAMSVSMTIVGFLALGYGCCAVTQDSDPNNPDADLISALAEVDKAAEKIRERRERSDPGSSWEGFLAQPAVSRDLRITDEERKRLSQAWQAAGPDRIALETLLRQPLGRGAEIVKLSETIRQKEEQAIKKVLGEERFVRVRQILRQGVSSYVFARDPEIGETLKLTTEQRSRINAILLRVHRVDSPPAFDPDEPFEVRMARARKESEDATRRMRLSMEERLKEDIEKAQAHGRVMGKLHREARDEILALLTSEQKKAWEALIGRRLTLDLRQPPTP
jgi:hypothetical protein